MNRRSPQHTPVLLSKVLELLSPRAGALFIDGTLGAGGHAEAILEASGPDGRLLGLDLDTAALEIARARLARFEGRFQAVHASYAQIEEVAPPLGFGAVDGILLDLGFSSLQVDDPERGFAFRHEGPLDMRYDLSRPVTAADLVNGLPEAELADLIYRYGEERHARRIAQAIVRARPLRTTAELAVVVAGAIPHMRREKIHPATRTFQALRIAVNDELQTLSQALPQAVKLLRPGGRLAVISFHSLEDRIVKEFFRRESSDCICPPQQPLCTCGHRAALSLVVRKPVTASEEETASNPRARSAKLRVAVRL